MPNGADGHVSLRVRSYQLHRERCLHLNTAVSFLSADSTRPNAYVCMYLCAEQCIALRCMRAGVFVCLFPCLLACVFVWAFVGNRLSLSLVGTSVICLRDCVNVAIGTHVNTHVCVRVRT